ncbi:TPA: phage tail spike protein [Streptococcus suis]
MIYLKDGNIPLNLAYDDDIVQEANSTYQLSFKFPLTDGKWNLLRREVFLLADDLHGEQEFFIFEVKKVNGYVQVYAKQVATLLNHYSINTISVNRVPGQTAMTALAGSIKRNCPFTFFSDIMDRHTFNESNVSVMDALAKDKHSIVGQWGGDLVRDKYQVKLLKNGGIENESLFMYKKNLSSYEESESINNLKTRLHLKKTIQGQSEGEADRVIAVTVDSPLIGQYRQIYEADIEVNDQDVTDVASLTAYGKRYFSSTLCDLVENTINLDVKGKADVSVKMFDTVSVFHERFDVDLRLKITSYHFGPMSKRLKSIGFGKVSQSVKSTVASMVADSVDKATDMISTSFEQKLQKEIDNANRHFDAEFDKRVESINDGIERSKAEAELYADNIKRSIDTEIAQVNQSMQAQSEEHDRRVAAILSKTQSIESLTNQAKTDAASALDRANQVKSEAIADARAQVATVSQALNTAKSELQTAIASADQKARDSQASATALTNRVTTVETLADGTRSTVAELSRTMQEATQDIASVSSRTRAVEDTLSQTRTRYEALTQTVNAQTGQIESINRKTADLQSGIDGVTERFESLFIGSQNLLTKTRTLADNLTARHNTSDQFNGYTIARGRPAPRGYVDLFTQRTSKIPTSDTYIASFYARASADTSINCHFFSPNTTISVETSTGFKGVAPDGKAVVKITTEWKRYWVIWKQTATATTKAVILGRSLNDAVEIELCAPALYEGTLNREHSDATEDLRSEIATYKRTAEESSAALSRQIQLADGKAIEAKTYAQQTADAIKTRLESLETYKNEEGTRASQYLTASREETARQLTAERTAIATNYVAKSIYDENVRGTTLKLNEIKTTADTAKQNLATYQNTVDGKLEELTSSTQTLDGKINTASTKITQNANEISKRLTSTQVDKAITDKGYQTKSDVDNNITGRGYITSSALQPYALSTTVQNLVQETADSFSRTISRVENKIPTKIGVTNLLGGTSSDWKTIRVTQYNSLIKSYNPQEWALLGIKTGDSVTFSVDVKTTSGKKLRSRISFYGANTHYYSEAFVANGEGRLSVTGVVPDGITSVRLFVDANLTMTTNTEVTEESCRREKLEIGAIPTDWSPAPEDLATVTALHSVRDTVDSHTRTIGAVGTAGSILDNVSKVTQTAAGLVQEVSGTNGLKTQVSQLAGSYAIQNLTSSGTVLNQLNLNKDGSVKIDGSLVQITGRTYIENGVISAAKIGDLDAGKIKTGTLDAARIKANSIDGSKIVFDKAFFNGLTANKAYLQQLFAKDAFITSVQAVSLSAEQVTSGILQATNKAVKIDLNNANITFNQNATINFNSSNNAIVRRKGTHTAFVHFNDVKSTSDGGAGSLYASIGVTSSGDGINSESSGRFAGLRAFRGAYGTAHGATVDQAELYGDKIMMMDDFKIARGFIFQPAVLSEGDLINMNQLVTCVRALRDMWAHYKNSNGTLSDLLNNRSNSSVNASWENMHSFK